LRKKKSKLQQWTNEDP